MSTKFLQNELESLFEIDNNDIPNKILRCMIITIDRIKNSEEDPSELIDDEEEEYFDDEEDDEDEFDEEIDDDVDEEDLPDSIKKADIEAKKILKEGLISDYV